MLNRITCFVLALIPFAIACSDDSKLPLSTPPSAAAADPQPLVYRAQEAKFVELSQQIPGFGGFYFEDGDLVVYLRDLSYSAAADAQLRPFLLSRQRRPGEKPVSESVIRYRQADYSFLQLAEWRDQLGPVVLDKAGVIFIDVDEASNRVAIAIEGDWARAAVENLLESFGVPANAVVFKLRGPILPSSTLQEWYTGTLGVQGGMQIAWSYDGGSNHICTLGFPAIRVSTGLPVYVTAAHCSYYPWGPDTVTHWQNVPGGTPLGREQNDPRGWSCDLGWHTCRYSDATLFDTGGRVAVGYIARTTFYSGPGVNAVGSITIDDANPTLTIIGHREVAYIGEAVDKIGRTDGWTWGPVVDTCFDFVSSDRKKICSSGAEYGSEGGDSGAPVFFYSPDGVTLVGIHIGADSFNDYAVFSPIDGIERDLGELDPVVQ